MSGAGVTMLYQIHRYPADLIDVVWLADGRRVVVRPVLPQDQELTGAFFRSLSPASRYERFMTSIRDVPNDLLRRLTHVDYADHLALIAASFEDGSEVVIAEARYVRGPDASEAEFAIAVAEPWRGLGLARLLLGKLSCRAGTVGVTRFHGQTLANNESMLRLARRAGFLIRPSAEVRGLVLLEKTLGSWTIDKPCTDAQGQVMAAA